MQQPHSAGRLLLALVFVFCFSGRGWGQEISLPPEVHGQPGKFISVIAETKGPSVGWVVIDTANKVELVPAGKLVNPKEALLIAAPGKYQLVALTCINGVMHQTYTWLIIGNGAPPPDPDPPPPFILAERIRIALVKDGMNELNLEVAEQLVKDAETVAGWVSSAKTLNDVRAKWASLHEKTTGGNRLFQVKSVINDYLIERAPWAFSKVLDDGERAILRQSFEQIALALKEVTK